MIGRMKMKILFYGAKNYDINAFQNQLPKYNGIEMTFVEAELEVHTAEMASGYEAICLFVHHQVDAFIARILKKGGVRLILLRCAGFNQIDLSACLKEDILVMRVPDYSPEAVAEMAMSLALAVNRKIHKAYIKVRENNFSLVGLIGTNFYGKTAGIVGFGRIGQAMARICRGFGMKVIAYDEYSHKKTAYVRKVTLEELLKTSDLISLHCPLTEETQHLIDEKTIAMMKDGVILVNTSRGGLVKTDDLIKGIREKKFFGVALDVYEEESDFVFENLEENILAHSTPARLLSFPNVIVTSHQAFLTREALDAIAKTTLDNALSYLNRRPIEGNIVKK